MVLVSCVCEILLTMSLFTCPSTHLQFGTDSESEPERKPLNSEKTPLVPSTGIIDGGKEIITECTYN